jgi:hypothetical protein
MVGQSMTIIGDTMRFAAAGVLAAAALAVSLPARAQPAQLPPQWQVVVIGEGSVSVAPDEARIRSGVTNRARTAREAAEANAKAMAAVTAALIGAGVERKDIQTARYSVQPVYESHQSGGEQKLAGFTVANQVEVTIRQIDRTGEILDRLVAAGATDIGGVEFLHADPSQALDRAREAAVVDARRKAELYARASGLALGSVSWITEDSSYVPPRPMAAMRVSSAMAPVPIAAGEDILHVRITVGFDMAH